MLWSEKLPFAGYSVVKDQMGTTSPNPSPTLGGDPDASLRAAGARICAPELHGKPANSQLAPERSAFAEAMADTFLQSKKVVERIGFEPTTLGLQSRCSAN